MTADPAPTEPAPDPPNLAEAADLAAYSQEDVGGDDAADLLLGAASAVAREYVGWRIAPPGADTAVTLARGGVLILPTLRLQTLDALTVDGTPVDVTGWRTTPLGVVLPRAGTSAAGAPWASRGAVVEATFTHGHQEVPRDVRAVVLAIATRALLNPGSLTQESIGGYSATYAAGATIGLLPMERAILDRHRLPGRA